MTGSADAALPCPRRVSRRSYAVVAGAALALIFGVISSSAAAAAPVQPVPAAPAAPAAPAWQWPLVPNPAVLRGFDPPTQRWLAGHRGVDLLASPGQEVHSAGAGTVSFAGYVVNRGVVVVTHGELRTTYEPVDASVSRGDLVARGAILGTVGATSAAYSHCAATCVHWGLRRDGVYLDPRLLVQRVRIRLLPVWRPTSRLLR